VASAQNAPTAQQTNRSGKKAPHKISWTEKFLEIPERGLHKNLDKNVSRKTAPAGFRKNKVSDA
jgi:hypothetical protein